jgi:hypothetical protein
MWYNAFVDFYVKKINPALRPPTAGLLFLLLGGMSMDENRLSITIIMHFDGGVELILSEYTTIDVSRRGKDLHINITSTAGDMALNAIYDKILEYLGEKESFDIVIKQGDKGSATFENMMADYHVNDYREVLHFTQK